MSNNLFTKTGNYSIILLYATLNERLDFKGAFESSFEFENQIMQ